MTPLVGKHAMKLWGLCIIKFTLWQYLQVDHQCYGYAQPNMFRQPHIPQSCSEAWLGGPAIEMALLCVVGCLEHFP